MEKLSLKVKILLSVCSVVLISYTVSIGYIEIKASKMTVYEAQEKSIETAEKYGGEIESTINHAMDTARTIAQTIEGLKNEDTFPDRGLITSVLKNILKENTGYTSVGCCLEPNALDNRDSEYINSPGHDSKGRFLPYWARTGGTLKLEVNKDFQNQEWYKIPEETGRELFTNPYYYRISGKKILMATAVVPIKSNGTFIGVVAIDIALDNFQKQVSKIRPFQVGHSGLVANNGFIVGHLKSEVVGKNIAELPYGDQLRKLESAIKKGEPFRIEKIRVRGTEDTFQVFVPIKIGKSNSPWSIGIIVPYSKILEDAHMLRNTSIFLGVLGILILFLVVWLVAHRIVIAPLMLVVESLKDIASGEGDLTKRLDVKRKDEIGSLAYWFNTFMGKLQPMIKEISGNADTISATSTDILSLTEKITENSGETMSSSLRVNRETDELRKNMSSVASAMEQAAGNVETVAAAAEEMNSTIREIAENTEKAHTIAENASHRADETTESMEVLDVAAHEISKITETISDISEQTNLLALNATIEAARAGEAGKGFAVVASEIKDLASQTSMATSEINEKIIRVQEASNKGIDLIKDITGIIHDVDNSVSSIAAAVEQQSTATQEVAENSNQVSQGIQEVNNNIAEVNNSTENIAMDVSGVAEAVNGIYNASVEARNSSHEQNHVSGCLNQITGEFKVGEKLFNIGEVKMAHLIWVTVVDEVLGGRRQMDARDVVSHKECEFGKWYFGQGQRFKEVPVFKELGVYHERVHTIVREIVDFYNKGDRQRAKGLVEEFNDVRRKLFNCLDELYKI